MYPLAEASVSLVLLEFQYCEGFVNSLKSVPPTATLYGVDPVPLTARPCVAGCSPVTLGLA